MLVFVEESNPGDASRWQAAAFGLPLALLEFKYKQFDRQSGVETGSRDVRGAARGVIGEASGRRLTTAGVQDSRRNDTSAAALCRRAVHQLPARPVSSAISGEAKHLAGAGGIEPPNGGIKIRCLTAWLRPIRRPRERRTNWHPQIPSGRCRSIGCGAAFQPPGGAKYRGVVPTGLRQPAPPHLIMGLWAEVRVRCGPVS